MGKLYVPKEKKMVLIRKARGSKVTGHKCIKNIKKTMANLKMYSYNWHKVQE